MNAYHFFVAGTKIAPLLPEWLGSGLASLAGLIFYMAAPGKRRTVMFNLARALPEYSIAQRRRVARRIFQTNIQSYYDLLRLHKIPRARLDRLVRVSGIEETIRRSELNGNKGIILFCGHTGSFSMGVQASTSQNIEFYLLVEPVKPPELFNLIRKLRESDPHVHTVSVASVEVRQIFRALKQPRSLVCIAVDRDVIGNGRPLKFFGHPAILPTGVAEIGVKTGALMVPVQMSKTGNKYHVELLPERSLVAENTGNKQGDVEKLAQQMLAGVEEIIRTFPDQWIVLSPIWMDSPK